MTTTTSHQESVSLSLQQVAEHFQSLDDPRSSINQRHPLESVLTIAVLAVLSGAEGPTAVAAWAWHRRDFLLASLDLPHDVPRKDVFRRVLSTLQPAAFQTCFANWLQALRRAAAEATGVEQPCLAIDGKTLRRSHDRRKNLGALHSVTVWASDFGLTLAQVACAEKSNEITAIPQLLRLIDLNGAIITIDAMGTQKAIAAQIVDGDADYVLALKGNQESLHQAVIDYADAQVKDNFARAKAREITTHETGHGREETRTYIQMRAPKRLPGFHLWKGLATICVVISDCVRNGQESLEVRYYISSLPLGVKRIARAIRSHWSIENSCHWSLDVTYREDQSRIRDELLRQNFAWLNRFTLSLLKQHPGKQSLAMKRRGCGWDTDFLTQVLTHQTT